MPENSDCFRGTPPENVPKSMLRISSLTSLPVKVRLDLARNQGPLELDPEVVRRAIRDRVDLNLRGTELGNRKDLASLLEQELKLEPSR